MKSFEEVRFPEDISYGMTGGPEFSTDIVVASSGMEHRNINWVHARNKYNVSHGVKTKEQLDKLISFFRARRGRAIGFRFKDWTDYQANNQLIAVGDGVSTIFQLIKSYNSGSGSYDRIINKPVRDKVTVLVREKFIPVMINYKEGKIKFPTPPPAGVHIISSFEFDVPVRFDTDKISASIEDYGKYAWNDIPLVEIKIK